jgi:hypothetical protein
MTTLEKVAHAKTMWGLLLPNAAPPGDRFLAQWAFDYEPRTIEFGIVRTSKKFRDRPIDPIVLHKYASGVMQHEHDRQTQGFAKWQAKITKTQGSSPIPAKEDYAE